MTAFKPYAGAKPAEIRDHDTLEDIAARARDEGNDITPEDISLFNWGAREPEHVQELMRDELGARARISPMEYALMPGDKPSEPLRVPEIYAKDGFATARTHTLQIRSKTCTDQFIGCCSLPSITFPFDSSFVRPDVADSLGEIEALIARQPDSRLMIFGHTDAVGSEGYNKRLSERRAWSVYGFILNDVSVWETLYNHPDEDWGLEVVQEILTDLGHDPGGIDGDMGPGTRAAMRDFLGLAEDAPVNNDAGFRAQLFAAYMGGKHDIEVEKDRFLDAGHMGCGEFNLLVDDEAANPRNRRVTIYAFHKDRPPNLPCAYDDTGPCLRQAVDTNHRHQTGFSCSFYDSLAGHCPGEGLRCLDLYLLDKDGYAIPNCPYRARNGEDVIVEGNADANGLATLPDSVPNVVQIDWGVPRNPAAAVIDGFRFSRPYIVSVSAPLTKSGCAVRLENLCYEGDTFEDSLSLVAGFFGSTIGAILSDFERDIDTWHKTGNPSHISGADEEDSEYDEGDTDGDVTEDLDDADWWEGEGGGGDEDIEL